MPKMEPASLTLKISLAQIIDTGNIREAQKYGANEKGEYPEKIKELAQSIKTIGQLQPVVVKPAGENGGTKLYELIAGFRRRAAFLYLVSIGEDFNMIDAKIATGDKLTIQLVENIQREDLTAPEREAAIFQLAESGIKQNEIAARLSKNKSFVSINISAHKMRQAGQKAGIDLTDVETSTFAELLSVPEKDLIFILRKLVEIGKTRAAASALAAPYKKEKNPESDPAPVVSGGNEPDIDPLIDGSSIEAEPKKPEPSGKDKSKIPAVPQEPIEAEHLNIDVNIILTIVLDYIHNLEKKPRGDLTERDIKQRLEAGNDILALIHKRLDDA